MIYNKIPCKHCGYRTKCALYLSWLYSNQPNSLKRIIEMECHMMNSLVALKIGKETIKDFYSYKREFENTLNINGVWNTRRDKRIAKINFQQDGVIITGDYEYFNGMLRGLLSKNILEGTWEQSNDSGRFKFEFSHDGISFEGYWHSINEVANKGSWSGVKHILPSINVSGAWSTTYSKMYLQQLGSTVKGRYDLNNGVIDGVLVGNTLIGTWSDDTKNPSQNQGKLRFTFNTDNTFKGTWGNKNSYSDGGKWIGIKCCNNDETTINTPIISFNKIDVTGTWDTDFGTLVLKQDGNIVLGNYDFKKGKLEGTLTGNSFIGTWLEDSKNNDTYDSIGKLRFIFSPDGNSFNGTWGYNSKFHDGGIWTGIKVQ